MSPFNLGFKFHYMNLQRTAEHNFNLEGSPKLTATPSQKHPHQENNGFLLTWFYEPPLVLWSQVLAIEGNPLKAAAWMESKLLTLDEFKARIAESNDRGFFASLFPNKVRVESVPPREISGSALVVWCISYRAYWTSTRFQFPLHYWLIFSGVELGIHMDSQVIKI